ncbi:hypothetical protein F2Q68_00015919 [Brassica cretica]|uniref:Uncharacterized protein n=2 Tax=Brassica cretica TaxID=69181 RepID=A0ABQ7EWJ4_BRACR|nr:hypothetical protein F2Q68_00015919 [Brassica cretica]KAF3607781.1 hypothetical protein DY000_02048466 [Brassica cretica]
MRNIKTKEFRQRFRHNGRFFIGSNKVMQVALGSSASGEIHHAIVKASKVVCQMKRLKSYHLSPVALFFVQSCFGESNGEGLTLTVQNFEGVEALQ